MSEPLPMVTATDPAAIATVLETAERTLASTGWMQGDLYDRGQEGGGTPPAECRMCLIGAANTAAGGQPRLGDMQALDLADAALRAVAAHLGLSPGSPGKGLVAWNDQQGRTVDEVRQALLGAAEKMRAGVVA